MNLFESVKAAVTVRQAAEHYGLEVGRNGMTRCPFHDDQMCIRDSFYVEIVPYFSPI